MTLETIVLGIAAILFGVALVALLVWAFKAFFGKSQGQHVRKGPEKRLGVVEMTPMADKRQLCLIRRDDVEHLIVIGGPVDVVVETGIKGRPHLEPPHDGVVIGTPEARPPGQFGKT